MSNEFRSLSQIVQAANARYTQTTGKTVSGSRFALSVITSLVIGIASTSASAHIGSSPAAHDSLYSATDVRLQSAVGGPDSDGDGIRNQDDLDDDNDGILDTDEGGVDNDGDGFADNDSTDTDGDGTPDILDLDSDNDGILDLIEARDDVAAAQALDIVSDGAIDIGIDVGTNGIPDVIETSADSGQLVFALMDTDGDGTPDFRDLDSDNDTIFDLVEAGGTDSDTDGRIDGFNDTDGKGVDDTIQSTTLPLFDTDSDGTRDFRDLDSDNDTISDQIESGGNSSAPTDTDGDGAADYRESDSDGDGISDQDEAGANAADPVDSDGDGTPDFQDSDSNPDSSGGDNTQDTGTDVDTDVDADIDDDDRPDRDGDGIANQDDIDDDNDGILDTEEGIVDADGDGVADANSRDTDGDGTPDGNDLDSDNDGVLDLNEGRLDTATVASLDSVNVNGSIDISQSEGANGYADSIETSVDSGEPVSAVFDTDGDGTPDYIDLDSDGDGISDIIEAGGSDGNADGQIDNFTDADGKGVDDAVQISALPLFDTDGDGIRDFQDTDSDNDSLPDSVEAGDNPANPTDTDGDGAADYREQDSDNDGISDTVEAGPDVNMPVDTNGDGIPDFQDSGTADGPGAPLPEPGADADGDGMSNEMDMDDDADGMTDVEEGDVDSDSDGVVDSLDRDSDNDGLLDSLEGMLDSDGDGVADYLDLDSDNDGIYDAIEGQRGDILSSGRLAAGAADAEGLVEGASNELVDTDGDGVPDWLDLDSDNDGLTDVLEALGLDADLDARLDATADANGDGADDSIESRPLQAADFDLDRIPNYLDLDSDQDGVSDIVETFGELADLDGDGRIDNFFSSNGSGLDDSRASALAALLDTDGDGQPNSLDLDSDDDGISDVVEAGGTDVNDDGTVDLMTDTDGDGIADINDADVTGGNDEDGDNIDDLVDVDFVTEPDSDNDGIIDSGDPDSDGNGFVGPSDTLLEADEPSQGQTPQLPDADSDGVPDLNQSEQPRDGVVDTGLSGSGFGCSVLPVNILNADKRTDISLGLLFGFSLLLFFVRRRTFRSLTNLLKTR